MRVEHSGVQTFQGKHNSKETFTFLFKIYMKWGIYMRMIIVYSTKPSPFDEERKISNKSLTLLELRTLV